MSVKHINDGLVTFDVQDEEQYAAVIQIAGTGIFEMQQGDKETAYRGFASATMQLSHPHKYVFTTSRIELKTQKEFLEYKRASSQGGYCEHILDREIARAEYQEKHQLDKITYLLVFGDSKDALLEEAYRYCNTLNFSDAKLCTSEQIKEFLGNYAHQMRGNYGLIDLFPESIKDKQSYAIIDDMCYVTYISVDGYPFSLSDLQIAKIAAVCESTITLDVSLKPAEKIRDDLDKSINELQSRGQIQQSTGDLSDAIGEAQKLLAVRDDIVNGSEHMVFVTLRFILSAKSYDKLSEYVSQTSRLCEEIGLHATIAVDEIISEYLNMFKPADTCGIPFPVNDTFSRQFPFYYTRHIDPKGTYIGRTDRGGLVYVDTFMRGQNRDSFDMLITGKKGSGKTVNIKNIIETQVALGNKCMVLDIESEYGTMADVLGGQVIKMTQSSIINVLQIFPTLDAKTEEEQSDIIAANYAAEMSRIITFFYQYNPNMTEREADKLKDILQEVYSFKGISDKTDVSRLPPARFPTLSDLYKNIRNRLYVAGTTDQYNRSLTSEQIAVLERLELMVKPLAEGIYKSMFNGHTTISVSDADLIVFDVKNISEMEDRVYNAQLFMILTLMWTSTCKNVIYNNNLKNSNDRRYVLSFIDEAHRFINTNNVKVTEFIETQVRRSRKYDASLVFASQSALDFSPIGNTAAEQKIKIIFDLVQYKVIMAQSVSDENIERLHKLFPQFTTNELSTLNSFNAGDMFLSLDEHRQKVKCHRDTTKADLFYMGNSRDRESIIEKLFSELHGDRPAAEYCSMIQSREDMENFCNNFFAEVMDSLGVNENVSENYSMLVYEQVLRFADGLAKGSLGRGTQ